MIHTRSPSFMTAAEEQRREVSPSVRRSPDKSPVNGHPNAGGMFYQAPRIADPKICVVNPTLGEQQKLAGKGKTEDRFMTVFESMLAKKSSTSSRKGSLTESVSSINSVNKMQKQIKREYKPSPSAASSLETYTPQREYSDIVEQLSQTRMTPTVAHDLTQTHTAYRIVNAPLGTDKQAPKVQAYKVETVFTPITSGTPVIGDHNRLIPSFSFPGGRQAKHGGGRSPARSVASASSPSSRSDIFQHLSARAGDDNAEEEFV